MSNWLNECTSIEEVGGLHRVVIGIKPRAYLRDGQYREMTHRLGDTGDAQLPHGLSELLDVRLADKLAGQSPQIHIGHGQHHIRMSALGTNNVPGAVVYDGTGKPIGRRYNGAWNNADLEWLDGGHYVKKQVYLRTGHPQVFEIREDDHAGNLVASNRGWDLCDDAGRPVLWAGQGYLFKPDDPDALTVPVPTTVRVQGGKSIYTYTLPPGNWAGWVLDPTWWSQPDAAAGLDTGIQNTVGTTTNNYGIVIAYGSGNASGNLYRPLLQFSMAGMAGFVQSALLDLYHLNHALTTVNNIANVFALLAANGGWIEGTKNGTQAGAGEPCWNAKAADGAGGVTTAWAGSAGCGTAGTDYNSTAIGSISVVDGVAEHRTTALTPAIVQTWLQGQNYGTLLRNADEATVGSFAQFAFSDHATAAYRPLLTIDYTLPGSNIGRGRTAILSRGRW